MLIAMASQAVTTVMTLSTPPTIETPALGITHLQVAGTADVVRIQMTEDRGQSFYSRVATPTPPILDSRSVISEKSSVPRGGETS